MSGRLSFGNVLGWALLVVLLTIYGFAGQYAPYLALLPTIVGVPYLIVVRKSPMRLNLPSITLLAAFGLLVLASWLSSQKSDDVLIMVNFIWLPLFIPMDGLLARLARPSAPIIIGRLALAGVAAALLFALYQRFVLGMDRAGWLASDPIRIANTSIILGFLSLVGVLGDTGRRRVIYFAAPVLAVGVAYLAGTRGAIVSAAVIAVVAAFMLVRRPRIAIAAAVGLAVVGVCALLIAAALHVPRVDTLVATIGQLLSGEKVTDTSAQIRLAMQHAGWAAFLESPWVGHGWQRIMTATIPHLPLGQEHLLDGQPHLHNDIANFGVAGGVVGLVAYVVLLLTPLVAALRSSRDRLYRARLFGTTVLTVSYATLGLDALMFGYEIHTALFCGLAAIFLGFCREIA